MDNNIELGTDAWLAARRLTVGGSEIAALFGLSAHTTKFQLWHQKIGNLPEPDLSDNDRIFWGAVLEPAIAAGIQKKTKWMVEKAARYVPHPRIKGMGASLDYLAESKFMEWGALEIKTVDWLQFKNWEDGEPPLAYELQLMHQLACEPDLSWGAIGVLVGGNDLKIFEYPRHAATIAKIEAAVEEFWLSIRDGKEPPIDFSADLDTIKALHREAEAGLTRSFPNNNRLPVLCAEYKAAGADEKAAGERKDAAKAEILTIIENAETALTEGWKITAKNVAEKEIAYTRKPYRDFRIFEQKPKGA